MAFTRFHDDELRVKKQLEQQTFVGRYQLDVPGNGTNMPFQDDTHLRMQRWGANLRTNPVNLESDLIGLTRPLGRDDVTTNDYKTTAISASEPISYTSSQPFVEESRASHPAWTFRDMEHSQWESPIVNPQANLEKPFHDNIQTRILEKDYYKPNVSRTFENTNADPFSMDYFIEK
jgi:hypothetical protein